MERWRGRVAVVTGACAGIGYSVTKALVEKGMKVVACARNIAAIEMNVLGLMLVTKEAFQLMQDNHIDDGHIILINRTAGKKVSNHSLAHCYSASKFAVSAIAEALRHKHRDMQIQHQDLGEQKSEALYSTHNHLLPADIADCIMCKLRSPPHVEVNDVLICPV